MEYGVRTQGIYLTNLLNKSSPSGDSFGQLTLQLLRKETKEGSPRSLAQQSCSGSGLHDGCTFKGMPAGRKTGRVGLVNITNWPPNAFTSFCLHVRVFSVTSGYQLKLICIRLLSLASSYFLPSN